MTIDLDNIVILKANIEQRYINAIEESGLGRNHSKNESVIIDGLTKDIYGVLDYILSENKDSIHIKYIEVFKEYRRLGIASYVVKLLNKDYTITGNSVLDALEFWNSLDAEFEEDIYDRDVYEYHKREGLCMPFIIH